MDSNYYFNHNELVKKTLVYIHSQGLGRFWPNNTGKVRSEAGRWIQFGFKGSPDIIGFNKSGRFVGLEIKTGKAIQGREQKAFERVSLDHGCVYLVVRGEEDFESIVGVIRGQEDVK